MSSVTQSLGRWLSGWMRLVLRFRKLVSVAVLGAAVLCGHYASTRLGINTDTTNMISAELPWRRDFIDFRESFAARDRNIAIMITAASAERADAFASALVARLEERPDLYQSVFAPGTGEFFERNALLYMPVADLEALADRLAAAQPLIGLLQPSFDGAAVVDVVSRTLEEGDEGLAGAPGDPLHSALAGSIEALLEGERAPVGWRRLLAADADGDAPARRLVLLRPELDFDRLQPAAPAVDGLRDLLGELAAEEFPDVAAQLTGSVAMEHEEMLSVRRGAGLAALASLGLVCLVLYAALRSLKLIAVALVTLVVGLTGTAAFAAAAVGHLNLLSVAFAVLYVGLGVDFIIHIVMRLKELLAAGSGIDDAIVEAVSGVGSSLVVCSVTTAAGFYAFIPTDFEGVSELGLISGTGMFISLAVSFTLLPALLGLLMTDADRRVKRPWLGTASLARLSARPKVVLSVTAAAVAVTFALLPQTRFDSNPVNLRDPGTESVQALRELAAEGDAPLYDLVAIAPDRETALDWADALRALPTVDSVSTVDSLVPQEQEEKLFVLEDIGLLMGPGFAELERKPADPAALEHALARLRGELADAAHPGAAAARLAAALDRFLERLDAAPAGERERLLAALDADVAAGLPPELERLETSLAARPFDVEALPEALTERWIDEGGRQLIEISPAEDVNDNEAARRFVESVREVVPSATGFPVAYQEASRTVVQSFQLAMTYALILVTLLLWVFLRDLRDVLLVLVPIMLAAGVTAGATVLLGIPLNFANIIALPLLVGVGVDNGIHMVHRMRNAPPSDGEPFSTSTSVAVLASGVTTVASFGNLGFSAHQGMASMGQLLTLGMIVMLAATLVLLPALLKLRAAA